MGELSRLENLWFVGTLTCPSNPESSGRNFLGDSLSSTEARWPFPHPIVSPALWFAASKWVDNEWDLTLIWVLRG